MSLSQQLSCLIPGVQSSTVTVIPNQIVGSADHRTIGLCRDGLWCAELVGYCSTELEWCPRAAPQWPLNRLKICWFPNCALRPTPFSVQPAPDWCFGGNLKLRESRIAWEWTETERRNLRMNRGRTMVDNRLIDALLGNGTASSSNKLPVEPLSPLSGLFGSSLTPSFGSSLGTSNPFDPIVTRPPDLSPPLDIAGNSVAPPSESNTSPARFAGPRGQARADQADGLLRLRL